jgi:hypothetical protein
MMSTLLLPELEIFLEGFGVHFHERLSIDPMGFWWSGQAVFQAVENVMDRNCHWFTGPESRIGPPLGHRASGGDEDKQEIIKEGRNIE